MALRLTKLIWLPCSVLILLFGPLAEAHASSCLSSPVAVKDAYPGSWPHWTMRGHGREGARCWHPGKQAAMHLHRLRAAHHQDPVATPTPVAVSFDGTSSRSLSATSGETSGTGWSLQVSAAPDAEAALAPEQPSFADRFAAVFEVILFERPWVMRRIEGQFSRTP